MGEKFISKGISACLRKNFRHQFLTKKYFSKFLASMFPEMSEISVEKATTSTEKEKKNLTNFSGGVDMKNGSVVSN